ncbi:Uncharacterised protein [BD1-7 clade bacterium]|uniref:Phage tail protein n=1 Tax=BD1-7 clade bacterium TaxID=2029982 RepID=A0A5S9P352_9GAMM|nr:Uncharacterised protein [BD1-7 clade bacterium]CAA0122836.1 Uncharacterised protein [BD1-7 clade bacterium]
MAAHPYILQFTQQGIAELVAKKNQGLKGVLSHLAMGSAAYTPNGTETALRQEQQRVEIRDYQSDADTFYLAGAFDGPEEYDMREMAGFLSDGTLLFLTSHPTTRIGFKAAGDIHIEKVAVCLRQLPANSLNVQVGVNNLNLIIVKEIAAIGTALANLQLEQLRQADRINQISGAY